MSKSKYHFLLSSLLSAGFFTNTTVVVAEKWLPIGPQGGNVAALAGHPAKPERLFASITSAGLFISNDAGDSWEKLPAFSNSPHYSALAVAPGSENTIYAGAAGGDNWMYRSTDGGQNWQSISAGLPAKILALGEVSQIAIDAADSQHLAILTGGFGVGGEIYQSFNGGNSWQLLEGSGLGLYSSISEITLLDGRLIISVENESGTGEGVFIKSSIDETWINIAPETEQGFTAIASSADGGLLMAMGAEGLWLSDDLGASWSLKNNGLVDCPLPGTDCAPEDKAVIADKVLLDPENKQIMFAYQVGSPFIWKTSDQGNNWQYVNAAHGLQSLLSLGSGKLYLGDIGDGVFYSSASGDNWQNKSTGLHNAYISDVKINPETDNSLVIGSYYQGMLTSSNNGVGWDESNQGLLLAGLPASYDGILKSLVRPENVWVDQNNPQLMLVNTSLFAGRNGLYRSIDGGQSWDAVTSGLPAQLTVSKIVRSSAANSPIYLASPFSGSISDLSVPSGGLFISSDEGMSWQKRDVASVNQVMHAALTSNGTLFVIARENNGDAPALLRSDDQGLSFQSLSLSADAKFDRVFTSPTLAQAAIFVTTELELGIDLNIEKPGKLYRSIDNGQSWQQMAFTFEQGPVTSIEYSPTDANTLYLGTAFDLTTDSEHIFKSTDQGENFVPVGADAEPLDVRNIAVNPHAPSEVYLATYSGGLYKSNVLPSVSVVAPTQALYGTTVTLDGSGSSDREGNIAAYQWQQTGGVAVALSADNTAVAQFTAPVETTALSFRLVVTDEQGESAEQNLTIAVSSNQPPTASIIAPSIVNYGETVLLDASGSLDHDGSIENYVWSQSSGQMVSLLNAETATASFVAPVQSGNLSFLLTVTDNDGAQTESSVLVQVNQPPQIEVATSLTATGGSQVAISATINDSDSDIALIGWMQTSGPAVSLTGTDSAQVSFVAPDQTTSIELTLTVNDIHGGTAQQKVTISVTASSTGNDGTGDSTSDGGGGALFWMLLLIAFPLRQNRSGQNH